MSNETGDGEGWIRRRAYQLWQEAGGDHGQHEDHWHQAEREYRENVGELVETSEPESDLQEDLIEPPPPVAPSGTEMPHAPAPMPIDPVTAGEKPETL